MTILCIETSTSVCSAAVCKDGMPIKQCICREGSNHARLLPRYIEELLSFTREQGLVIDAVALSEGPGSYTGLRIGTSTAKGLCYGLNIPLIPIPTLAVLCEAARERLEESGERLEETTLVPLVDARRMEVYAAIYDSRQLKVESLKLKENSARAVVVENEESLCSVSPKDGLYSVSECNERSIYYFGDGAEKCSKIFTKPNWHYIPDIVPEAQYMGVLADKGERLEVRGESIAYYEPYYLKEFIAAPSHVKGLS